MDLIGKSGKIDGILAAQVLLDGGVFFFKPGELYYDGTYHQIKGMQANTSAMKDFPGIFDQMDSLAPELVNLMVYVEKNTKFRVKQEALGSEIQEFLQNEDMTGMTFLYLFKWHLLALNRNVNGITASMETRVRAGIPDAEDKVLELVRMLVAYDGTDPDSVSITVIEVDASGKEVPKQEPKPEAAPEPVPTAAPVTAASEPEPAVADATPVSVVETTVSEPTQTATQGPEVSAPMSAALPAELGQYMNEIKPKLQTIVSNWGKCQEEYKKELSTVRFTGFSDPKIKEYRDKIADKQEEFGEDLEEILEDLYEHIEKEDAQGLSEEVLKSVLDQERECYAMLTGLQVDFEHIGVVDYRISRRCSRNHEKWDEKYRNLPSVLRAQEEERRNQERKKIEDAIDKTKEKIAQYTKEYTDAKSAVENAQKQMESQKGNLEEDRKKLIVRAEAAVGAVEERIRENSLRIEELEVENRKLDDELKDASGFAIGRKKTIKDTIDYNTGFINKYRDVGKNLEAEKQQVTEEWNRKLDELTGDSDRLQATAKENTEKMKTLEQSIAAERQTLQQQEAELAKL